MQKFISPILSIGAVMCAFISVSVTAAGGGEHAEKPTAPVEFEYRGDVTKGKKLSMQCAACHGPDGNSVVPSFPKIAGQHARYIHKQLHDMKPGDNGEEPLRPVAVMAGIAAGLSDQDIADLAAYFESQAASIQGADPELIALGEKIYRAGNSETNVPACTACHQPDGAGLGLAGYPRLSGQHPEYTVTQLKAFRAAGREDLDADYRVNDGETMQMRLAAKGMSDKEIQAVSAYVAGLMKAQALPAQKNKDAE